MNIIQWRDINDLSRGFILDLENCTFPVLFSIYSEPASHVEAFTEAFQMMGFHEADAKHHAVEYYEKTRLAIDKFIDRYRDMPVSYAPPANTVTH